MERFVITIGREYGSGGKIIGEMLAKRLNIPCYDKELLQVAAKESGYCEDLFEKQDEEPNKSFLYSLVMDTHTYGSYATSPYIDLPLNQKVFLAQFDAIKHIAEKENCVMVGRCANYALENEVPCLNVFIHADFETRIKNVMAREESVKTESKAKEKIRKIDKKRANYYNYYANNTWGEAKSYDLTIDSSKFSYETCVDIICRALEAMKE